MLCLFLSGRDLEPSPTPSRPGRGRRPRASEQTRSLVANKHFQLLKGKKNLIFSVPRCDSRAVLGSRGASPPPDLASPAPLSCPGQFWNYLESGADRLGRFRGRGTGLRSGVCFRDGGLHTRPTGRCVVSAGTVRTRSRNSWGSCLVWDCPGPGPCNSGTPCPSPHAPDRGTSSRHPVCVSGGTDTGVSPDRWITVRCPRASSAQKIPGA